MVLSRSYRYTEQQFSELTAAGSPVRPLMIALSMIPYTLLVAAFFAVGVFTSAPKKRAGRITGAMLPTMMNRVYGASAVQGVPVAASRHCLRITASATCRPRPIRPRCFRADGACPRYCA